MKKGEGEVQLAVADAIKKARKFGITTQQLASDTGNSRQYIRKIVRALVKSRKVRSEGKSSPTEAPILYWKK